MFEIMIFDNHIRWKNGLSPGKIPEYRGKCKRPKTERNYHKSKEKKVYDAIPDHYKPKNMDKEPRHTFIFVLGFVWYLSLPGCKFCDQILYLQRNLTDNFFSKNCSGLWNLNHEEWRKKKYVSPGEIPFYWIYGVFKSTRFTPVSEFTSTLVLARD